MNILQIAEIKQVAEQVIEGMPECGLEPGHLRTIRLKELFSFAINEADEVCVSIDLDGPQQLCSFPRPDCIDGAEAIGFLELLMYREIDNL